MQDELKSPTYYHNSIQQFLHNAKEIVNGQPDMAEEQLLKALKIAEQQYFLSEQYTINTELTSIYMHSLKDRESYLRYAKQCLDVANKMKDTQKIAESFDRVGGFYWYYNQYKDALEYFLKANELFNKTG